MKRLLNYHVYGTAFTIFFILMHVVSLGHIFAMDIENKDNQIKVTADRLDINNEANSAEFSGNVQMIQKDWVILSDRLKIFYSEALGGKDISSNHEAVKKVIAEGNVTITSEGRVTTAEKAEYYTDTQVVVLTGKDATISSDNNSITGAKITLDRKDENIRVERGTDKRVTAVFYPDSQTDKKSIIKSSDSQDTQNRENKAEAQPLDNNVVIKASDNGLLKGNAVILPDVLAVDLEKPKADSAPIPQTVLPVARVKEVGTGELKKKVGVLVIENKTPFALPVFDMSFYNNMVEAISKTCKRCVFIKPGDKDYPDFFTTVPKDSSFGIDSLFLKKISKELGFNDIIFVSVLGVFFEKEDRGMMWFKNVQNVMNIQLLVSVYDTVVGAKIYDVGFENKIDIDETALDLILADKIIDKSILIEPVEKIVAQINKPVGELLNAIPWQGRIISVSEESNIILSSGHDAGLVPGNIFDVFDMKIIEGFQGQAFYMPGDKTGEIQIKKVYQDSSMAVLVSGTDAKAGSLVRAR